jgi:hypothetical protein
MTKNNVIPLHTLEEHLSECETRYQAVIYKLDVLDRRMTGIEQLLLEIKQAVKR